MSGSDIPVSIDVDNPDDLTISDIDDIGVLLGWFREKKEDKLTEEEKELISELRKTITRFTRM